MDFADIQRIALALPGVETGLSYGTPALKVRGKLLARLKEDGTTLVLCAVLPDERALLMEMTPSVFHVTDHYVGYPTVLIHLDVAEAAHMAALIGRSWERLSARARKPRKG